jgi:hypothetical protein
VFGLIDEVSVLLSVPWEFVDRLDPVLGGVVLVGPLGWALVKIFHGAD